MESRVEDSLVSEVKVQWKRMWRDRFDDRVLAEGVASMDFDKLFVERGTVVLATRNFRLLTLRDILERHRVENVERHVPVNPSVGGWGKFVRTHVNGGGSCGRHRRAVGYAVVEEKKRQQLRKGGRGWLHV